MKKVLMWATLSIFCFCVVGVCDNPPQRLASLPIGSAEAIETQVGKEISRIDMFLSIKVSSNTWRNMKMKSVWHSPPTSKICTVITNDVTSFFSGMFRPVDAGLTVWFSLQLTRVTPANDNFSINNDSSKEFTVVLDRDGKLVIPFNLFIRDPLVWYIPITGAATGVERVDYIWKDVYGNEVPHTPWTTTNGAPSDCWLGGMRDALYLDTVNMDPTFLRSENWHGEVRIYYSSAYLYYNGAYGQYDAFDMFTGRRNDFLRLKMNTSSGTPRVDILGFPGKSVMMESSTDLRTWEEQGLIVLDQNGEGVCIPPPSTQLFFRGRLVP